METEVCLGEGVAAGALEWTVCVDLWVFCSLGA